MSRGLVKGPYVPSYLLKKVHRLSKTRHREALPVWCRDSTIVPVMIGHTMSIHNGRYHLPVFLTDQMVGHKLGEFAPTRRFRGHIKKNKKVRR